MTRQQQILRLDGCRTTPLASYLKALGILRLVAEQADPAARGWWEGDTFQLGSTLDPGALREFLLHEYRPTAVLGPWNGGSGFFPKDTKGIRALAAITEGEAGRFAELREAIAFVKDLLASMGFSSKPDPKTEKPLLVTEIRSRARGSFLKWVDAAIALGTEDLHFPPLLGSGGNDGRLDFTVNFLENLASVIDPAEGLPRDDAHQRLDAALYSTPTPGLTKNAIGQFSPGAAGGPNATSGFEGSANMNPWDFVLMIEGAILFAASAVRRLESSGSSALAYPFAVRPTAAGAIGTATNDARSARAETWLPVWSRPACLRELQYLLQEGRIVVGNRSARDGLDVARAVARLGVDRGIDAMERFAFMQRAGKAYLATPLGRMEVRRHRAADLIDDLEVGGWLPAFRRIASDRLAPARLSSVARRLEEGLFELAQRDDPGPAAWRLIVVLGECQQVLASSPSTRSSCRPVPALRPGWVRLADDGSSEFAVSLALADLHAVDPSGVDSERDSVTASGFLLRTAEYLTPVRYGGRRGWQWTEGEAHRVVWSDGPIVANVGRMVQRRLLDAEALGLDDVPFRATTGLPASVAIRWASTARWDPRVASLVRGLALVVGRKPRPDRLRRAAPPREVPVPAAFALLKPYFTPAGPLDDALAAANPAGSEPRSESGTRTDVKARAAQRIVRLLAANRVHDAVGLAHRDLRAHGLCAPSAAPSTGALDGRRLLAALVLPLERTHLARVLSVYFRRGPVGADTLTSIPEGN